MIFCGHSRLRDAVAEHIPEELRNREKMGFEMPFTDWMTGGLRDSLEALLAGSGRGARSRAGIWRRCKGPCALGSRRESFGAFGMLLGWMDRQGVELD